MDSHRSALRNRLSRGPAEGQETGTDKALVEETERLVAGRRQLGTTEQFSAVCGWACVPRALHRAKRGVMKEKRQRVRRRRSPSLFLSHNEAVAMVAPPAATIVYIVYFLLPVLLLLFYYFVFLFFSGWLGASTSDPHQAVSTGPESKLGVPPRKSVHGRLLGEVAANDELIDDASTVALP